MVKQISRDIILTYSGDFLDYLWLYLTNTRYAKGTDARSSYIKSTYARHHYSIRDACFKDDSIKSIDIDNVDIWSFYVGNTCIKVAFIKSSCVTQNLEVGGTRLKSK